MNSPVIDRPTRPAPPLPDLSFVKSRRLNVKTPHSRSDSQLVRKRSASRELQDAVRARAEKNRRQNRRSWLLSRVSDWELAVEKQVEEDAKRKRPEPIAKRAAWRV